jgi:hypothetical protein
VASEATSGAVLRAARRRAGLSQAELARRAGIAQSVVSVYESGRRQPSVPTLGALVSAAGFELQFELRPTSNLTGLTGPLGRRLRGSREQLCEIAASYGVRLLAVFGSVARGEERPDSDIDLLVELPSRMGLVGLARLEREFEEVLDAAVDIVPERDLKPRVRASVERDAIAL